MIRTNRDGSGLAAAARSGGSPHAAHPLGLSRCSASARASPTGSPSLVGCAAYGLVARSLASPAAFGALLLLPPQRARSRSADDFVADLRRTLAEAPRAPRPAQER